MQKYETLYVLQPNLADEKVDELVGVFEGIIPANSGSLVKTDRWGRRKLAYRIGKHWEGTYILHEYEGDGATQRELERRLKIHEDVLRHLTTKVDPRMALELERRAEREKRMEGRRSETGGPGRRPGSEDRSFRDSDDDDNRRGSRREGN